MRRAAAIFKPQATRRQKPPGFGAAATVKMRSQRTPSMPSDPTKPVKFSRTRRIFGWFAVLLMRALVLLPLRWQIRLCKAVGRTVALLPLARRRIAEVNIAACFPELSAPQRRRLVRDHFGAVAASLAEISTAWFGDEEAVRRRIRVEGEEHLRAAQLRGQGTILFAAHFTSLEFFWVALRPLCPRASGMYKWQKNPVMNEQMNRARLRYFDELLVKDNVRRLLRNLQDNYVVWYASDQRAPPGKNTVLVPFFGVPAMTSTAISRIARVSGASVLPFYVRRVGDGDEYVMTIQPPVPGFPSGDDARDARDMLKRLEDYIRLCPEQYFWTHKRFKDRPPPLPDLYAAAQQSV
jgi:KDO2-lipid IV(A) lauroyltransferase